MQLVDNEVCTDRFIRNYTTLVVALSHCFTQIVIVLSHSCCRRLYAKAILGSGIISYESVCTALDISTIFNALFIRNRYENKYI